MEEKMLRQLAWIKWLLVAVIVVLVIPMSMAAFASWSMLKDFSSATATASTGCSTAQSDNSFWSQSKDLLMKGKEQEVLALAKAREAVFPKDAYVFLYRGRAYFQLGEYKKAIEALAVAETIAPDWREQYIVPYVAEAKRRLAAKKSGGDSSFAKGFATQTEIYEQQLQKSIEMQKKMERLLDTQELHAKRFGVILDKWEHQADGKKP